MLRTVALLDILGFRDRVQTDPLEDLAQKYENALATTESLLIKPPVAAHNEPWLFSLPDNTPMCQRYVFSDTLILISDDDGDESCARLIVYTWRLAQALLALGFPIRGAGAFGEMYTNPARQVYLGRALYEAYSLEQRQEWVGIALSRSLDEKLGHLLSDHRLSSIVKFLVVDYTVPMKTGLERLRTLNWRFNLVVQKGTRSLFRSNGDSSVEQKIANTLKYAGDVRRRSYANEELVPIELRTMFVGEGPPPPSFGHGDEL